MSQTPKEKGFFKRVILFQGDSFEQRMGRIFWIVIFLMLSFLYAMNRAYG